MNTSPSGTGSKSTESENRLEVVGRDEDGAFIIKVKDGNGGDTFRKIDDAFAEICPLLEVSPANPPFFMRPYVILRIWSTIFLTNSC